VALFFSICIQSLLHFRKQRIFAAALRNAEASSKSGGLAQLARALAWHARGHRFESGILHLRILPKPLDIKGFFFCEGGEVLGFLTGILQR